jgi:8-oxo-dGTP diphosphatase
MDPFQGWWDIPGGFLEIDELPSEAAMREVEEKTGLTVTLTDLFGFYLGRYASGNLARSTLNIYFIGAQAGGEEKPGNDATELAWFAADELPDRIAFDHAREVFQDWRDWLACTANGQESAGE